MATFCKKEKKIKEPDKNSTGGEGETSCFIS